MSTSFFSEFGPRRQRAADTLARSEPAHACAARTRATILRAARIEHHASRAVVHRFGQAKVDLVRHLEGIPDVSDRGGSGGRHANACLPAGTVFTTVRKQFERDGMLQPGASGIEVQDIEALRQASEGRR